MDTIANKFKINGQLWMLFGPMFIACTLFIVVVRAPKVSWIEPLVAVLGLFLCYQWRWRGVLISLVLLAAATIYQMNGALVNGWLWPLTLSLTLASSFVVTALTSEESSYAWEALHEETKSYNKTLGMLNDSLQSAQQKSQEERQELLKRMEKREQDLAATEQKRQAAERLIGIVREELAAMHAQQEKLLQELFDARQHAAQLEQNLADEPSVAQAPAGTYEAAFYDLKKQLAIRENEIKQYKSDLEVAHSDRRLSRQAAEDGAREVHALRQQRQNDEVNLAHAHAEQIRLQANAQELSSRIETLSKDKESLEKIISSHQQEQSVLMAEKEILVQEIQKLQAAKIEEDVVDESAVPREIRRIEGLYQQLREQFMQKSNTLDATRRELFKTQEKLLAIQKENEELQIEKENEIERCVVEILASADREMKVVQEENLEEIAELHEVISTLTNSSKA